MTAAWGGLKPAPDCRFRRAFRHLPYSLLRRTVMQPRVWHRFYDEGVPPGLDFEARPLPAFLERGAREHADATALIFLNRQLTYRQFKEDVDRFATALSALGVERGTRVAIQLPNLPQTVIAFYAVLSLGGIVVMTNPLYVAREIEHQWNDAGCTVAITADFLFTQRVAGIRSRPRALTSAREQKKGSGIYRDIPGYAGI